MAKGEGESSIAPFAGDTFALRLAHWLLLPRTAQVCSKGVQKQATEGLTSTQSTALYTGQEELCEPCPCGLSQH